MATASDPTRDGWLVPLRNGPTVPVSLISWLITAEDRGLKFRVEADGHLHVGPKELVTPADLLFVRENKALVISCVNYIETMGVM